jgi:hypothetical protein
MNVQAEREDPGKLPVGSDAHVEFTSVPPKVNVIVELGANPVPAAWIVLPSPPREGESPRVGPTVSWAVALTELAEADPNVVTLFEFWFTTYAKPVLVSTATPSGLFPTGNVPTTEFVLGEMALTLDDPPLATRTSPVLGSYAIPPG